MIQNNQLQYTIIFWKLKLGLKLNLKTSENQHPKPKFNVRLALWRLGHDFELHLYVGTESCPAGLRQLLPLVRPETPEDRPWWENNENVRRFLCGFEGRSTVICILDWYYRYNPEL